MKNIKPVLIITTILFCYSSSAFSKQYTYFRINHELNDSEDKATGIAYVLKESKSTTEAGISINKISSDKSLESNNRNSIYPVYGFANISLNTPITPFIEFGIDLGDFFFDKINEGDALETDIYYSAGIKFKFHKQLYLTIYAKAYELYFNEIDDITIQNVTIDMKGASLAFYF
jgi:hypothetical protein